VTHSWNGTHVSYTPGSAYANGQVIDVTVDVDDNVGNSMTTYSWSFTIDTAAPVASNPRPTNGAYTADSTPTITLALTDALSGIDTSTISMTVEGSGVAHSWNGTHVSYTPSSAFANGQVIDITVDVDDNVGNSMTTYSWSFTIDTTAPVASNPRPTNGAYTADSTPTITLALTDTLSGIDTSTISMTVEGSGVTHSWNGTHVSYTPGSAFANGQVIDVTVDVSDNIGNAMTTYSWSFTIDTAAPVASNPKPTNGAYTSDSTPTITLQLTDALSGIDTSTISMTVEGSGVTHSWNGTHVSYTPGSAFADGQVIDVTVDVDDNVGNSMTTYSWSFTIDISAPIASNERPTDTSYVNDATPTITVALSDTLSGIDSSTIVLTVESSVVGHSWNGTHVSYTPGAAFADGQVINVDVDVSDNAGNAMVTYSWSFTIDVSGPVASGESPADSTYTNDATPTIILAITDSVSGVDASTISMTVEGSGVTHSWNGTHVSYTPGSAFVDGQVIDITVDASDNVGNAMATYSWSFTIDISVPVASNPNPSNGSYVNDATPTISATLTDTLSGVDSATIQLRVEGVLVSHSYVANVVSWTPGSAYADGQVINVTLDASDNLGNAMSTYEWYFIIDVSAPVASNEEPTGTIANDQPLIRVKLEDTISGINFGATQMLINGSSVSYGYDGENLTYTSPSPMANGVYNVSIFSADNAGNVMSMYQWTFTIFITVPYAYNPSPANNSYTNDATPTVVVYLDAYWGIDDTTIRLWLNGTLVAHTWSAPLHRVRYIVSTPYNHGDIINATVQCNDTTGSQMDPYIWLFTIDLVNPTSSNLVPTNGAYTNDATPTISVDLQDALSGINATTIAMTVEGSPVAHSWDGLTVSYTPGAAFADGQVIDITVDVSDNAGNAMSTVSWSFTIDISAPTASNERPTDTSYVNDATPTITVALSDSLSGVDSSTIVLTVESSVVGHSWNGTHVSYTPSSAFSDGQVVNVDVDVSDNAGNAMTTYSWSFTVDLTAPTINIQVNATYMNSTSFYITINVTTTEVLSGLSLNVTDPSLGVTSVSMSATTPSLWQGQYEVKLNGSYTVSAAGQDVAGNIGTDTDGFIAFIMDFIPPNFIGFITNPVGLLYNQSSVPTNWTGYSKSAGYGVNITALFNESVGSNPIVDVKIYYKTSTQGVWIMGQMTEVGNVSSGGGLYNVYYYSYIMPQLENGTVVEINIVASDSRPNELYNISECKST